MSTPRGWRAGVGGVLISSPRAGKGAGEGPRGEMSGGLWAHEVPCRTKEGECEAGTVWRGSFWRVLYSEWRGAGGAPRRAEVVWPLVGGGLYYKGTIEVALEGLTQKEFDALSVRVEAVTDPGASVVGPICLWEGWPEVPVVTGSSGRKCVDKLGGPSGGQSLVACAVELLSARISVRLL